jgi:branched-chain amino acid transport system ATP-binding protein
MTLLDVRGLSAAYGDVQALHGIDLRVDKAEVVAVLGANGAGKSTLLKTIVGQVRATGGTVQLAGVDISSVSPDQAIRHGITLCPEGRRLFPEMTVAENIRVGAHTVKDGQTLERRMQVLRHMFPKLVDRAKQLAGQLSGGEQQMVAIARALVSEPRLLLLDEPTLGLAPKMIHEVARLVKLINAEGTAVILVEQNAKLALKIADRGYVLENGLVSTAGTSAELLANDHVQKIYLGG